MNERRGREANVNKIAFCCCYFMYFIIIIIFIGCCVLVVVVGIVSHPYIDIKQESEMDGSESQGLLFSHTSVAYRGQIFFYFIMLSFYYASWGFGSGLKVKVCFFNLPINQQTWWFGIVYASNAVRYTLHIRTAKHRSKYNNAIELNIGFYLITTTFINFMNVYCLVFIHVFIAFALWKAAIAYLFSYGWQTNRNPNVNTAYTQFHFNLRLSLLDCVTDNILSAFTMGYIALLAFIDTPYSVNHYVNNRYHRRWLYGALFFTFALWFVSFIYLITYQDAKDISFIILIQGFSFL